METGDEPFDDASLPVFDAFTEELDGSALPGFSPGAVREIANRLALTPGDLLDRPLSYLHLDNPVRAHPFVNLRGRHYCFSPSSIPDSQGDILELLLAGSTGDIRKRIGKARNDALEAMTAETLCRMFPDAEVHRNVYWIDPRDGKRYETDIIVIVEDVVMIFEAKGVMVSPQSRRGSNKWFADLDAIVVAACEQVGRLASLLGGRELSTARAVPADLGGSILQT